MSEVPALQPPDERAFRADVAAGRFQSGVDRGEWQLVSINWPHALVAIVAAERQRGPREVVLRFELSGYPITAPTASPWDLSTNAPLSPGEWPKGDRIGKAFNPNWNKDALYIPCDRTALSGHDGWRQQYARYLWDSSKDITDYLRLVHELLNDDDYKGV